MSGVGSPPNEAAVTGAAPQADAQSAPATSASSGAPSTSTTPTASSLWRVARTPVLIGVVVLFVAGLFSWLATPPRQGSLDPRAAGPSGTMALARLLEGQGVQVDLVRQTAEAREQARPGTTLLVAVPGLLGREQLSTLSGTGADVVLVQPSRMATRAFAPDIEPASRAPVQPREPVCALPAAAAAGEADMGGQLYDLRAQPGPEGTPGLTHQCYAVGGSASLVQVREDDRRVTALGTGDVLTNDALDGTGNAALSMRLLGAHERLVWYLPSPAEALGGRNGSVGDLVPGWVVPAFWQLVVAVLLVAVWRARRLGPVVAEPLPVVVRAAETAEGRARLYRRARARDRAAESLRAASRARIGEMLTLPRDATPQMLVTTLASRTGRHPTQLSALLYGAAPGDDAALVSLADALDDVEREVRGR